MEFDEIVHSAKHDPDYRELDFSSSQSVSTSGFGAYSQLHTILRDSVTYYREIRAGVYPSPIIIRANKCYVSERNQIAHSDLKDHLTYLSRDTAYYLLLPFARLIDSIPASKPISVSDTLWVVEGATDSASYRLEYNPISRKIGRIRWDTRSDSMSITASHAFYWDSVWKDTIVYPKVTTIRASKYNPDLKGWTAVTIVDSTLGFVRPNGTINGLFLARDDFGRNIACDDGTSIRILSPAKDELWAPGTTHRIQWESIGIPGDVFIQYFNRRGYYEPVVTRSDTLPREFTWTVPDDVADLSTLRIESQRSFAVTHVSFQARKTSAIVPVGKGMRRSASGSRDASTPTFTRGPASQAAIDAAGRWIRPVEPSFR